jgi:hypothetical protein
MVPATPNFEVTNAAVVEASPAANTWLPLTTGVSCPPCPSALLTTSTLSMTPSDYKEESPGQKRVGFDASSDLLD